MMFKSLKQRIARIADQRKAAAWRRGYDYAAGELLRGQAADVLEAQADCLDRNSFDHGINAALDNWHALPAKGKKA